MGNRELDKTGNYVITIGRQFGSGGRELGQMIAGRFGIEYYDKKLLGRPHGVPGCRRRCSSGMTSVCPTLWAAP